MPLFPHILYIYIYIDRCISICIYIYIYIYIYVEREGLRFRDVSGCRDSGVTGFIGSAFKGRFGKRDLGFWWLLRGVGVLQDLWALNPKSSGLGLCTGLGITRFLLSRVATV